MLESEQDPLRRQLHLKIPRILEQARPEKNRHDPLLRFRTRLRPKYPLVYLFPTSRLQYWVYKAED